jgi:hypothetical protein
MADLSQLLPVAVVLLVIVVGVAFWQRRATVDASARARSSAPPSSPAVVPVATAAAIASRPVPDDVLGQLTYDGKQMWEGDREMAFAGTTVFVEITAGAEGPSDAVCEIARTAMAQQSDLDARARALLTPALPDMGWEGLPLAPFSIAVRPDAHQRLVGVLWYEVGDMDGEVGVASADLWRTLEIERMY